ncbi:MAG: N-acetyltransferase family protein [Hyphomicrobium sp.]
MNIVIRPIQEGDAADWNRLFRAYIEFYCATVPDDVIGSTWRRALAGADGLHGLIALNNGSGEALGIATLVFHRSTWSPTWYCYLEDLYVEGSARGRGVGRALIEAIYAEADRRDATRTYWATQEGNKVARRLYDEVGELTEFVQYRRREPE